MEVCGTCGIEKPLDRFAWKKRSRGTTQSVCKSFGAVTRRREVWSSRSRWMGEVRWFESTRLDLVVVAQFGRAPGFRPGHAGSMPASHPMKNYTDHEIALCPEEGIDLGETVVPFRFTSCDLCGAVVHDEVAHTSFHASLAPPPLRPSGSRLPGSIQPCCHPGRIQCETRENDCAG